ncbi:MAG: hypothetical protein CVU56_21115 [Deltaproteobacteria bacterium HGW-Deltaproteobacteria-14]|jgi:Na+-transporting methylmalonyl-CoA/oxaloacetate decarboxylase gamma subunit|nr:MAG: hypothetical protein CVU56_21115 [Deltaproteobacteria bacterium HGW-Deltaproteobacteria-14]
MTDMQTGLHLTLVGIPIVFSVLAMVALVVWAASRVDRRLAARQADRRELSGPEPEPTPTIDDTTLVLITAAAATMIQGRFHIRRIRRIAGPGQNAWFQQGRAVLHGSHVVNPKAPR